MIRPKPLGFFVSYCLLSQVARAKEVTQKSKFVVSFLPFSILSLAFRKDFHICFLSPSLPHKVKSHLTSCRKLGSKGSTLSENPK